MQRPDGAAAVAQLPFAQLCFGQVRHKRLRPAPNAFEYPALYVRLPLRTLGAQGFGTPLFSRNRSNLLSFFDADHGDGRTPLLAWIEALLDAEGVQGADGEVWLQAMPRVLGFVFNPVSFWFCHSKDGALRAVLCDVRNTFGERHFYLLDPGREIGNGSTLCARKVFHVSPFCPLEGSYRFRFVRATRMHGGRAAEHTLARIDYDDSEGALLETSVSGTGAPIGAASALAALLRYPLATLAVVARIHLQALRLWLRRVPFHTKPAPPPQKVTR